MEEEYDCDCYITAITYQPQQLMICVLHDKKEVDTLQTQILDVLQGIMNQEYQIYPGTLVAQVTDIRASYLRSLARSSENEVSMVESEDGVTQAIRQFAESLETGNVAVIRNSLEMVESQLSATKESEQHKTYYCYKLMNVYLAKAKDMRNYKLEAAHLISFDDEKQLFEMLHQSVERFCVQSAKAEQATAGRLRTELIEYIESNFNNKNLSLAMVADHLNTSVYIVTRLFKETTGKNFKEYVLDKRMEYARELLKTTTTKIAEISSMAGFESAEYFSSVFKSKYGMTPTQYRKSDIETIL
jgi:two-component system response regulator YesN